MAASPLVAVDVVIFTIADGELRTLLVELKHGPFSGRWGFPGGLVRISEAPETAAARELSAQTGLRDVYLEQLRTFGDPSRDPHQHVVSVAFFALMRQPPASLPGHPKYGGVRWTPLRSLPALAYDHNAMAVHALNRLRAKLEYTNIVYSLLPERFTLGDLQEVYEVILGRRLDRRNFRKKVLALGLLRGLPEQRRGPHRPARLYAFTRHEPVNVAML